MKGFKRLVIRNVDDYIGSECHIDALNMHCIEKFTLTLPLTLSVNGPNYEQTGLGSEGSCT